MKLGDIILAGKAYKNKKREITLYRLLLRLFLLNDLERAHHLVLFVLEYVAMIDIIRRKLYS